MQVSPHQLYAFFFGDFSKKKLHVLDVFWNWNSILDITIEGWNSILLYVAMNGNA